MTADDRAPKTREELKRLWEATTPGTWYDHNVDDDMCMNVYAVTTSPNEPDLDSPVDSQNDHAVVVALTLLQSPRLACHASEKWAEDARFIAAAHNAFGSLLASLDAAEAEAKKYREALNAIGDFCESPDGWEHDGYQDDAGYHLDCAGRERVRVMVEEALGV